jgi:hypothetical protein
MYFSGAFETSKRLHSAKDTGVSLQLSRAVAGIEAFAVHVLLIPQRCALRNDLWLHTCSRATELDSVCFVALPQKLSACLQILVYL